MENPSGTGKIKNKPGILYTYSSPQCFKLGQDYPGFTNEVAGAREVKPAFLRATHPGRVRAQSPDWGEGGLRMQLPHCHPALPSAASC